MDWIDIIMWKIKARISSIKTWWFWYSPPWKKTRRCPECAGIGGKSKRDTWFTCSTCQGKGVISKMWGYRR